MSKKHNRQKQRAMSLEPPAKILFTLPAVRMLKDALCLLEKALLRNTKPLPNLHFAKETLEELRRKLDAMLQREDWDMETGFDYNEPHMLYAAVHMYLAELRITKKAAAAANVPPIISTV